MEIRADYKDTELTNGFHPGEKFGYYLNTPETFFHAYAKIVREKATYLCREFIST